jgi:hypothetical protein
MLLVLLALFTPLLLCVSGCEKTEEKMPEGYYTGPREKPKGAMGNKNSGVVE